MIEVIPAIIPESLEELKNKLARVRGIANTVQVDVIDGIIAPPRTWPYTERKSFESLVSGEEGLPFWEDFEFEFHLMIRNPEKDIEEWLDTGISSIVFHPAFSEDPATVVEKCRVADVDVGFAFLPSEESEIKHFVDEFSPDCVQVMGNDKIGYHGVQLDEHVYEIIRGLRDYFSGAIAIDIGVNTTTAPLLVEAGATKLIAGSAIFGSNNPEEAIQTLKSV